MSILSHNSSNNNNNSRCQSSQNPNRHPKLRSASFEGHFGEGQTNSSSSKSCTGRITTISSTNDLASSRWTGRVPITLRPHPCHRRRKNFSLLSAAAEDKGRGSGRVEVTKGHVVMDRQSQGRSRNGPGQVIENPRQLRCTKLPHRRLLPILRQSRRLQETVTVRPRLRKNLETLMARRRLPLRIPMEHQKRLQKIPMELLKLLLILTALPKLLRPMNRPPVVINRAMDNRLVKMEVPMSRPPFRTSPRRTFPASCHTLCLILLLTYLK